MINEIKQALKDASNDVTWAKGRAAMDDNAPEWLAALVEFYEAAQDMDEARYQAARKKLEGK